MFRIEGFGVKFQAWSTAPCLRWGDAG